MQRATVEVGHEDMDSMRELEQTGIVDVAEPVVLPWPWISSDGTWKDPKI